MMVGYSGAAQGSTGTEEGSNEVLSCLFLGGARHAKRRVGVVGREEGGVACDEEEGGEEGSRSRSREKGKVADSIVLYLLLCQHIEEGGMSAFERRVRGEGGRGRGKGKG